ncbi:MAG TPA: BadF/BadG/BcrA/BcrD ATPase family protein [Spirochaetia bacterium]|nr:BadF/BadG/BcrA/BcrD ATPase family protein [Spirochaetia bacterium]
MSRFILGVDGGATKTDYRLVELDGDRTAVAQGGIGNHEWYPGGYKELATNVGRDVSSLLATFDLSPEQIAFSVFGMAGADFPSQKAALKDMFRAMGFRSFVVVNDALLGIWAGTTSGYGVCSVNGTGTSCAAIDYLGKELVIGGSGYVTGDDGGSGYIGATAVRRVFAELYQCGTPTRLSPTLSAMIGISEKSQFLPALYERYLSEGRILADFAPPVFEAASQGDEVAGEILRSAGEMLGRSVAGAIRELTFGERVEVVLSGAVYRNHPDSKLTAAVKETVLELSPVEPQFRVLQIPPVLGAVVRALSTLVSPTELELYRHRLTGDGL